MCPIVRGKAGKRVEFGANISISHQKDGYVSVDTLSWDAYNESGDLPGQIERYKQRFDYYSSSVHAIQFTAPARTANTERKRASA